MSENDFVKSKVEHEIRLSREKHSFFREFTTLDFPKVLFFLKFSGMIIFKRVGNNFAITPDMPVPILGLFTLHLNSLFNIGIFTVTIVLRVVL